MHILILCPTEEDSTRAVAGLILKNNILRPYADILPEAWLYVKTIVLQGMRDKSLPVRQTVGTVIVNVMSKEADGAWPEGLEALMKGIDSEDPNEQEVSV